jgi:uncharacterized RDD family membrane protein YckC
MSHNFCQNCSARLMVTLKMCPSCGSKNIDSQMPQPKGTIQQVTSSTINSSASTINSTPASTVNSGQGTNFAPAPLGPRFLAFVIDTIAVSIAGSLPILFSYLITLPFKEDAINPLAALGVLASFAAPYIYYTAMHATPYCATLGKRLMNIKIINTSGVGLTKMEAFLRVILTLLLPITGGLAVILTLGSMAMTYKEAMQDSIILAIVLALPFVFLGPYLLILFNPLKQSLFDVIMKTIVIKGDK